MGLAGREDKGQGALGCHLQQDQQLQQAQGDPAHREHLGDLHCLELLGDPSHPGGEKRRISGAGSILGTFLALSLSWTFLKPPPGAPPDPP